MKRLQLLSAGAARLLHSPIEYIHTDEMDTDGVKLTTESGCVYHVRVGGDQRSVVMTDAPRGITIEWNGVVPSIDEHNRLVIESRYAVGGPVQTYDISSTIIKWEYVYVKRG